MSPHSGKGSGHTAPGASSRCPDRPGTSAMEEGRELNESKIWVKVRRTTMGWKSSRMFQKQGGRVGESSIPQENCRFCPKSHVSPGPWPLAPDSSFLTCPPRGGSRLNQCFPKNCAVDTEFGGGFNMQVPVPQPWDAGWVGGAQNRGILIWVVVLHSHSEKL